MEEEFERREGACPRLLDLISTEKEWVQSNEGAELKKSFVVAEETLELRLAPPGGEDMSILKEKVEESPSFSSLSYFSMNPNSSNITITGAVTSTVAAQHDAFNQPKLRPFQLQVIAGLGIVSSQKTNEVSEEEQRLQRKAYGLENRALGKHSAQTRSRTTSSPSVGWPPVRSFRKNLASNSSKPSTATQNDISQIEFKAENSKKGLFLKINMDGIPIGRKVDLNACNSYMKLASAVEELFCDLLAAQKDPTLPGKGMSEDEKLAFTGLLDGTGEYTLIYEDNEGDRMLVGDVPWDMFVSTAKRLRVLKSSELSDLSVSIDKS